MRKGFGSRAAGSGSGGSPGSNTPGTPGRLRSLRETVAEPGESGFCMDSCGAHPVRKIIWKVAGTWGDTG